MTAERANRCKFGTLYWLPTIGACVFKGSAGEYLRFASPTAEQMVSPDQHVALWDPTWGKPR